MIHDTRESWLRHAGQLLTEHVLTPAGYTPGEYRVSCGWPARGALAKVKRTLGECWAHENNKDKQSHVFVSPVLDNPAEVTAVLLHELLHASLPAKAKHGKTFAKAAVKCGLEGKPTSTVAGQVLAERINAEMLPLLGAYPHSAIDATLRPKQKTRMLLWQCACPVKVRAAAKSGFNATCNVCYSPFARQDDEHTED